MPHTKLSRLATGPSLSLLLVAVVGVTGCSDGRVSLGRISGTVTVGGDPLPAGQILFKSDESRMAVGRIENGSIVDVTTYESGDGAPVGTHRIAIQPQIDEEVAMKDPAAVARQLRRSEVAMKYRQARTSGLTAEIKRGSNELTYNLMVGEPR